MQEFKINRYLTLKLEDNQTSIYINGEYFDQCKFLLLNIPVEKISSFDEVESIDEAAEKLEKTLERDEDKKLKIPPEVEFWGHCSNLQVWVECKYDTRLLHSNLAFPILRELSDLGDNFAKIKLKEEIIKRFKSGFFPVVEFLINEGYLRYFNNQEVLELFIDSDIEREAIIELRTLTEIEFKVIADFDFYDNWSLVPHFLIIIKDQHIIGLNLVNNKFKEFPKPILKMKLLQKLILDDTSMTRIPDEIETLTLLEELGIRYNKIEDLPDSIGKLSSLKKLSVERNLLSKIPKSVFKLKLLENLHLSDNHIILLPKEIDSLKSLKHLNLARNEIKKISKSIGNLKNLEGIKFEGNKIETIPQSMSNLKSLQYLWLAENPLKQETYEFLKGLKKRIRLDLIIP